jgi:hypothetical protein
LLVLNKLLNQYLARIDRCYHRISSIEELQRGLDHPASAAAIFAMAERTSDDVSLAAAPESDPLPPDAVASGAEELLLVPSGPISPVSSLQPAASSNPDEPASQPPSRTAHQPPTSGDGVIVPEHIDFLFVMPWHHNLSNYKYILIRL